MDSWRLGKLTGKGRGEKKRFLYCLSPYSSDKFLCFRAIEGHSGGNLVDPLLHNNVLLPEDFTEYINHIGNAFEMHSILKSGLIPGGKRSEGTGSQCFSQPWTRWIFEQQTEKLNTIWTTQNRTVRTFLDSSPQYSILVHFEACSEKGIAILSNWSHAMTLSSTLPAICKEKWYAW